MHADPLDDAMPPRARAREPGDAHVSHRVRQGGARARARRGAVAASVVLTLGALAVAPAGARAQARSLEGTRTIVLDTRDGATRTIGRVTFARASGDRYTFRTDIDTAVFTDHFLSMKEFKCLEGGPELMCFVPYPYQAGNTVTESDFAWLEHALLFMFKRPSEFGANLWNGVYFRLTRTEAGLAGTPQAVDLNHISAPAADLTVPPFRRNLREDYPAGARWIRSLRIE